MKIAGVIPRLMALIYDALLIIAILLLAAVISTAVSAWLFPGLQEAKANAVAQHPVHTIYLLTVWYGYYAYSWRRGGQTLGMKAWRLKLINHVPSTLTHAQMLARFFAALLGLGLFMALFHSKSASMQDIVSNTAVIQLPRTPQ